MVSGGLRWSVAPNSACATAADLAPHGSHNQKRPGQSKDPIGPIVDLWISQARRRRPSHTRRRCGPHHTSTTIGPRSGDDGAQYLMLSPKSWPMNKSTVWLEDVAGDLARFGESKETRVSTHLTATRKSRLLAVREWGEFITLVWRC